MDEVLETFIVRTSYFSKLEKMSDEQLGKLFRAIFSFVLSNGEATAEFDDILIEMAYGFITDQIGKDMKRYHQTSESRRKSALEREAKKRERKRGKLNEPQTSTNEPQTSTNEPQTSTNEPQTSTNEPQTSTNEHKRHSNNNNIRLSKDNHCNINKDSFNKESKSTLSNAREERFEIWWNAYDKKVEREKTRKKWFSLSDEDQQKCIDIAPRYVKAEPDKKFRKNPLTYLNGECWNDEIIEHEWLNMNDYDRLKERRGSPAPGHTEEEYHRGNTWEACV